jgi:hypothetical protein
MVDVSAHREEQARLARLVGEQEAAKARKRDAFGLSPIGRGFVRGRATNIRQSETTCEYGVLVILEFDLLIDPTQPPIPVHMEGTTIDGRLLDGHVVDLADPTPSRRPITPDRVYFSHHLDRKHYIASNYPGRRMSTPRQSLMQGMLVVGVPMVLILGLVAMLNYVFHIFG